MNRKTGPAGAGEIRRALSIGFSIVGFGLLIYLVVMVSICQLYVNKLIHPACYRSSQAPAGFQDISLTTPGGVHLLGWWRPPLTSGPHNGAVLILIGGLGGSRDTMLTEGNLLVQHGYGVLALDSRSCAGELSTLGVREIDDLDAGVRFARSQPGVHWVGALGFSAGAVTVIRGAARLSDVDAVIAEGNFYTLWGEIADSGAPPLSLEGQIERIVAGLLWLEIGVWPPDVSPITDLPKIQPRPVLLIHGELEASRNHASAQYAAAGEPKKLYIMKGADHGTYWYTNPQGMEQALIGFLDWYSGGK